MTLEALLHYGTLWSLLVGVISLVVAVHIHRRQVRAQLYFEVTKRFDDLLHSLPQGLWLARFNSDTNLPPPNAELSSAVHRYFAFLQFMHYLAAEKYLSPDVWAILLAGIHRTLVTPLFVREWSALQIEFEPYPEFVEFVDKLRREGDYFRKPQAWPPGCRKRYKREIVSRVDKKDAIDNVLRGT